MTLQGGDVVITLCGGVEFPNLDQIVTSTRDEASDWGRGLTGCLGGCELAGKDGRRPTHGIHPTSMRGEDGVGEGVVFKAQHADFSITARGGQVAASFGGRPGDEVDGGGVEGEFVDALPRAVLFAPDEDAAVVGGGGEDGAVFGVGPGHTPHGSLMAFESVRQAVLVAVDFKHFDRLVRGACCQSSAVVVEDCVVLGGMLVQILMCFSLICPYNHIIVTRVGDDLRLGIVSKEVRVEGGVDLTILCDLFSSSDLMDDGSIQCASQCCPGLPNNRQSFNGNTSEQGTHVK